MKRIFIDMDGTAAEWRSAATMEELFKEGYFLTLKPTEITEYINSQVQTNQQDAEYYILSAYYPDSFALAEKKTWNRQHLPGIAPSHQLYVPCGINKARFVEEFFHRTLGKDDILIDDHTPNLIEWTSAGGKAIKWLNGINGHGKRFSGDRVGTITELHDVLKNS